MKILLTGASGFLGNILYNEWRRSHEVYVLGRKDGDAFQHDLTEYLPDLPLFDMVVHAAGKAHVIPGNKKQEQEFYDVNVTGTMNLLKALEVNRPKTFIFISSVAVYGRESGENIDESFPLSATDAYGKSKIEAEKAILNWSNKNGVATIILRLPLIAGPNPPGNLGSMMRAIRSGYYFRIGDGRAKRSVVNAIDLAQFIPQLSSQSGIYNLVNQHQPTIAEIDAVLAGVLHKRIMVLPFYPVKVVAWLGNLLPFLPVNSLRFKKLTTSLTFSGELAVKSIGWKSGPLDQDLFK